MQAFSTWNIDASQILSRQELARVRADLSARAGRLASVRMNLIIVRLACCCGLRAREIEVEALSPDPEAAALLETVGKALREAGARPSASGSKLARVLGVS